ncbi:MAG: polymer-forming cytoskeletal protein [Verrucomicrobiota bacterium]
MPWVENFQHLFKESGSEPQTLISEALDLKGDLFFNGDGNVAGTIKGSMQSDFHVTIDEAARINGPCHAGNLHVSGRIDGDVRSREHIRLSPAAYVRGDLNAATLEITPAADFQGALKIGISDSA